jgi:hypothetical protein
LQENYTDDRSGNTFIFALQCVGLLMGGISALTSCRAIVIYRQLDGPLFRLDAFAQHACCRIHRHWARRRPYYVLVGLHQSNRIVESSFEAAIAA